MDEWLTCLLIARKIQFTMVGHLVVQCGLRRGSERQGVYLSDELSPRSTSLSGASSGKKPSAPLRVAALHSSITTATSSQLKWQNVLIAHGQKPSSSPFSVPSSALRQATTTNHSPAGSDISNKPRTMSTALYVLSLNVNPPVDA